MWWEQGDFNGDNTVDGADLQLLYAGGSFSAAQSTLVIAFANANSVPLFDRYTAALSSIPSAPVTITVQTDNQLSSDPIILTFAADETALVPQTVYVAAVDDDLLEGDHSSVITHAIASADGDYDQLAVDNVPVAIHDNEMATVSVQAIRDANETDIVNGQFLVSLDLAPAVNLNVAYSVNGTATSGSDYSALSGTVTILAGSSSATIEVPVIDDGITELVEVVSVQLTDTSMPDNVTMDGSATDEILVFSNDLNIIEVNKSTVTVSEDGTTATFQVSLGAQPLTDVIVNVASANTAEVIVSQATLTFSSTNWNTPQTITVTGVDDGVTDGTQNVDVRLSIDVAASSPEFRFSLSETVNVLNADNEASPATARLEDVTFYNKDANREDGLSLDQTGQRSIVRHVQVVLEGTISITEASLTDGTFAVTNLSLGEDVALIFDSVVQSAGRTVVVLSFAEGTSVVGGGLVDGNYQLKIDGGPHSFDADGSGAAGGVAETLFHRLFGDTDGDRDVDNSDYGKFYQAYFGDEVYQATLDRDDDNDLFDEIDTFFSNYGKQLTS